MNPYPFYMKYAFYFTKISDLTEYVCLISTGVLFLHCFRLFSKKLFVLKFHLEVEALEIFFFQLFLYRIMRKCKFYSKNRKKIKC